MTQARLRIHIFGLWVGFWIVSTLIVIGSAFIRADFPRTDIVPAIFSITGIWVPALTCLAAFWFPQNELESAKRKAVSKESAIAAFSVTIVYLGFVLTLIIWSIYFIKPDLNSLDPGEVTFLGQIGVSVRTALVVSPIALAPINWLTGGSRK